MTEWKQSEEVLNLGRAFFRLRSNTEAGHLKHLFQEVSFLDYEVLSLLSKRMNFHTADKIYLSEISKELDVPIQRASAMAKNLQAKGLVYWSHDRAGNGTYIRLSELGKDTMEKQQKKLLQYFSAVVDRIGVDEFRHIVQKLELLEDIMLEEATAFSVSEENPS